MIIRIVKMTFFPEAVQGFRALFNLRYENIRYFEGCRHLELWQDENDPCIFFTYSQWETASDLEHYRHSTVFLQVWAEAKKGFSQKPEAWTVTRAIGYSPKEE